MTESGDPNENALAEQLFRTLKEEFNLWGSLLCPDAKQSVYLGSKVVVKQLDIPKKILVNLDTVWLESRSESARHFHQQVRAFLKTYNKTIEP